MTSARPLLAAALCAALAPMAQAGGFAGTPVEPVVIADPGPMPGRSSAGVILPLLLLGGLIALAASSGDDDDEDDGDGGDGDGESDGGGELSDARLKADILRTGTSPTGLPTYTFRYLGGTTTYEGVMAQDLLTLRPEAVVHGPLGVLLVDYGQLDVAFRAVD